MKITRLLETTLLLLNRSTVTAGELAERFGVSTRTIYRDIDELSAAGVPVYTNKGSGGGISLLESYAIDKAMLTDHEKDSLLLALKTLQATNYPEIQTMLDKIGAVFKKAAAADWVHIEFSPWGSGPNEENKFLDIKQAILQDRCITFDYLNADNAFSRRTVEPMQLSFKGQAWYLWGFCTMRQEFRTFRISRMKKIIVTDQVFKRRPLAPPEQDAAASPLPKLVTIKLRFRTHDLYRLHDDYDENRIIRNPDGTCDVTVTLPEDEWVYGYVLSFGPDIEVLGPPHIREIIRERLKNSLKYYE